MDINQSRFNSELAGCAGWGLEKLKNNITTTQALLAKACGELKVSGSYDDVKAITGATVADVRQKMSDMNTDLAAWQDTYTERQKDQKWSSAIVDAKNDPIKHADFANADVIGSDRLLSAYGVPLESRRNPSAFRKDAIRRAFNEVMNAGSPEAGYAAIANRKFEFDGAFGEDGVGESIMNATFSTASWSPESVRSGRFELLARHLPTLPRILPVLQVNQAQYVYIDESTATGGATRAESAAASEATLAAAVKTESMKSVAVTLPVTAETLEDVPGSRAYITRRLPMLMEDVLDTQLLSGDGAGSNFNGFLNRADTNVTAFADTTLSAPTQAKTLAMIIAVHLAMMNQIKNAGPSGAADLVLFNPQVFHQLVTAVDANGNFMFGPVSQQGPRFLFGIPFEPHFQLPVNADAATVGLMAAFRSQTAYLSRKGMSFAMTDSHGTEFTELKTRFRLDMRGGLAIFKVKAVTKLNAGAAF